MQGYVYYDVKQSQGYAAELYFPLFLVGETYTPNTVTTSGTLIKKGGSTTATRTDVSAKLFTLSSAWPSTQKFCFEASIGLNSIAAYAALWDITSDTIVTASQVSYTSSSFGVVRSGTFTLTPGNIYGVTVWSGTSTGTGINKAFLVAIKDG